MTTLKNATRSGLVLTGSVALCLSMSACGGKSTSSTTKTTTHVSSASAKASASGTSNSSSHKSSSTKSNSTASCTHAKIGGVSKCINVGQMCSHKHAADYTAYGFACKAKGNEYILSKA